MAAASAATENSAVVASKSRSPSRFPTRKIGDRMHLDCAGDALYAVVAPIYISLLHSIPFSTFSSREIASAFEKGNLALSDFVKKPENTRWGLDCLGLSQLLREHLYQNGIDGSYLIKADYQEFHVAVAIEWKHSQGDTGLLLMDLGLHFPLPLLLRSSPNHSVFPTGRCFTQPYYFEADVRYVDAGQTSAEVTKARKKVPSNSSGYFPPSDKPDSQDKHQYILKAISFKVLDDRDKGACRQPLKEAEFRLFDQDGQSLLRLLFKFEGQFIDGISKQPIRWDVSKPIPDNVNDALRSSVQGSIHHFSGLASPITADDFVHFIKSKLPQLIAAES